MSILVTCGFERQSTVAEGLAQESATAGTYSSSVNGTGSTRCMLISSTGVRYSKNFAASSEIWLHARVYIDTFSNMMVGFSAGSDKDIYLGLNGSNELTISTGSGASPASTDLDSGSLIAYDQWYNLHLHVKLDAVTGFFRGYINGAFDTPDVEYTGDTSAVIDSDFIQLIFGSVSGNSNYRIDDIIVMDPTDATGLVDVNKMTNPVIKVIMPNGAGAKATQASGAYTDIDELPPSGTDFISYDAVGQESTFTTAAQSGMVQILGKTVWARIFRNDTAAGENIEMEVYDSGTATTDYSDVLAAPSDGAAEWTFELDANGDEYDQTQFNNEQFGFRTAT